MPVLIFLWYLVTTPADRLVCTLWAAEPPGRDALVTACGTADLRSYRLDVISNDDGSLICTQPGNGLPWIREDCGIKDRLDNYTVRVVQPNFSHLICSVRVEHDGPPTRGEIQDQCGVDALLLLDAGRAKWDGVYSSVKPTSPQVTCAAPQLPVGFGIYDQAPSAASLWADKDLAWLAGRLIWFGIVRPTCAAGKSGLDPQTLAADGCGMAAAKAQVTAWQNQFDDEIYNAAITYRVPARLLKRIIEIESQYWPLWENGAGEYGMLQISESGIDVLLRYDADLDAQYPRRTQEAQLWKRREVMAVLSCAYCSLDMAVQHASAAVPVYARLLAAYRCRAVEINPALTGAEAWRQAAADYNGGLDYLRKVEG